MKHRPRPERMQRLTHGVPFNWLRCQICGHVVQRRFFRLVCTDALSIDVRDYRAEPADYKGVVHGRGPSPTNPPPRGNGRPRRLLACVQTWAQCAEGTFNPSCCRYPKSCSCTVYSDDIADELLEPQR